MRTIELRKLIGFPQKKEDWAKALADFSEHALRIAGHPVMEDWEREYMEALADIVTKNGGNILEVGYGMGLSALAIQAKSPKHHTVIECHPEVVKKGIDDFDHEIENGKMTMLSGFWEDVTPTLKSGTFDGILFDTYPLTEEEIHSNHFWFFNEAYRLLKPGGVFTYYSDEASNFSEKHTAKLLEAGFKEKDISFDVCKVSPPKKCEYWQSNTIIAPKVYKETV